MESTLNLPMARIAEGATEADLIAVIDLKIADSTFDRKYLRPETLFNATKFQSYVGQVGAKAPEAKPKTLVQSMMNILTTPFSDNSPWAPF
jgi:uncharacterized phage protein (TIGR02220 family)